MADVIQKRFTNFVGLDLKSSNITRQDDFASDMLNAQYQKDGDIEKRKGYKANAASQGGFGLFNYNRIDPVDGLIKPELLSVDTNVHKRLESVLTVTYTGGDPTSLISIFFSVSADEYKCQILEGTGIVLDFSLGKGFDEAGPVTVDSLRAAIDGLANFSAVVTGATSTPAAFLDIVRDHDLTVSALDVSAGYWSQVYCPTSDPLAGSETNKNRVDFENASSVQLQNVLYISNGYDEVLKYDGQSVYRAGIPEPTNAPTTALVNIGGGAITDTGVVHAYRYVQVDAVGNFVEGDISPDSVALNPAGDDIDVTVDNILAASGFNTNCAIVAGAQGPVNTITVDDGAGGSATLQAGDTAYFFDSVSGGYVERLVTAASGSSITVAGAAVTVADNAVISNNLRIQIYRNNADGLFKYLVDEIPNNSFVATQTYTDTVPQGDPLLGNLQFIPPVSDRGLPPKGKYLASFNSQMVIGGQIDAPDQINWSDIESAEYFPIGNNLRVETDGNEKVTGIAQNNESFAVFKNTSIDIITGDIAANNIRREVLTRDVGCVAHATIKEVENRLFFLSDRGVFSITSGQLPVEESTRIEPIFKQEGVPSSSQFIFQRAIGINHREDQKYILYLPVESSTAGPDTAATTNSVMFVYDYFRRAWLKWNNYNMAAGAVIHDKRLYFSERRLSSFTSTVDHMLYCQMSTNDAFDYMDHDEAVLFSYSTSYFHFGEPSVFKHFIRIKVHSIQETANNTFDLSVKSEANFQDGLIRSTVPLDLAGSVQGYGIGAYGVTPYGDLLRQSAKHKLNHKAQSLRFTFENSSPQENVGITGYEVDVSASFRPEIKD